MGSILAGSKGHPHPIDGQGESGLGFVLWVVSFAFTLGKMKNESLAALGKGTGRAILCRSAWPPLLPFCWFLEERRRKGGQTPGASPNSTDVLGRRQTTKCKWTPSTLPRAFHNTINGWCCSRCQQNNAVRGKWL